MCKYNRWLCGYDIALSTYIVKVCVGVIFRPRLMLYVVCMHKRVCASLCAVCKYGNTL